MTVEKRVIEGTNIKIVTLNETMIKCFGYCDEEIN